MKKKVFAVCLMLFLAFSVPSFAESSVLPTENEDIMLLMNQIALASTFDYEKLWYYQPMNCICIDVAEDGFAAVVSELLNQRLDETYEPWAEFRDGLFSAYMSVVEYVAQSGVEDVGVSLSFVNDDIYMRDDDSNLSALTFLTFQNGEVYFDLLRERAMLRVLFGE